MGDIIVISVLVIVVALIIKSIVRNHRRGNCMGCPYSASCSRNKCGLPKKQKNK